MAQHEWFKVHLAVGQNKCYHFGVGAPPILVYFSGDWDVHWGCGLLTHGHLSVTGEPKVRHMHGDSKCIPCCAKSVNICLAYGALESAPFEHAFVGGT